MSRPQPLFDQKRLAARRATRHPEESFLYQETAALLLDRLGDIKQRFEAPCILGPTMGSLKAMDTGADKPDLILSHMELHWSENLNESIRKIYEHLAPQGLFLGACFGSQTLGELRHALQEAEIALKGGLSPRFSPLPDLNTASTALEEAGFAHQVVDREPIRVRFPNFRSLLHTIRAMGETNALMEREKHVAARALFRRAEAAYRQAFSTPEGDLEATFEVIFFHGWKEGGSGVGDRQKDFFSDP